MFRVSVRKKERLPFVVRFLQREIGARAFFLSHHLSSKESIGTKSSSK